MSLFMYWAYGITVLSILFTMLMAVVIFRKETTPDEDRNLGLELFLLGMLICLDGTLVQLIREAS